MLKDYGSSVTVDGIRFYIFFPKQMVTKWYEIYVVEHMLHTLQKMKTTLLYDCGKEVVAILNHQQQSIANMTRKNTTSLQRPQKQIYEKPALKL